MRFAGIIIEQALFGLGNFLVSWMALRHLASDQLALFAFFWSATWAVFAILSETLITPLRVEMASTKNNSSLELIRSFTTYLAIFLIALSLLLASVRPLGESLSLVFLLVGIPSAAIAFYTARSIDIELGRPKRMLRRGFVYASCSFLALMLVSSWFPSTAFYPLAACSALLIGSLDSETNWKLSFASLARACRLVGRVSWTNRSFGVSTALRVTLFSSGLIFVIGLTSGNRAVAVYAAYFVLISPIQLASSSLPWILLSRQARLIGDRKRFLAEMFLQLAIYIGFGLVASGILSCLWEWWVANSISDAAVRDTVGSSLVGVLLLMAGILLTSWSSTLAQVLKLGNAQLFAVVIGGLTGFSVVLLGGQVVLAALAPYSVSLVIASIFIFWKANAIGRA